jgi:Tfp pilus assembly protein PilX
MRKPTTTRRAAGFVTLTVLLILVLAFVGAVTLLGLSQAQVKMATNSQNRLTGLVLAEAGVDDAAARIASDLAFAGHSRTLYEDPPANTRPFGTFRTTVTRIDTLHRRVTSVGTNPNGTTMTAVAVVTIEMTALGNAAIMANGQINVNGTMQVGSDPPDLHIAHVYANGNVSMGGSSYVDGYLAAAGVATGTAYYASRSGVTRWPYPDSELTTLWHAQWLAEARAGGTVNGVRRSMTITGPKFIDGDLTLNNDERVTLSGSGVVYVNGNVNLTAQSVLTNGVTLVVRGSFSQGGQAVYKIDPTVTPTPTLAVIGAGYGVSDDVVQLAGGSLADNQGIIYAVNGSIKVAGGSTFVGALVAGAPGAQVTATGGYTQHYPEGLASSIQFPTGARVTGVTEL